MGPFSIILIKPPVKVFLQGLQVAVHALAERDLVELVQDGFVEALTDAVGLGRLGLGLAVIDVIDGQVELIVGLLNVISRFLSRSRWRKTSSLAENTMFVVVAGLLEPEAAYHPGSLYRMGLLF